MLAITSAAGDYLAELLDEVGTPQGVALRFQSQRRRRLLMLRLDRPRKSDRRFEHDGRTVLVLDREIGQRLWSFILDLSCTPEGVRLRLLPQQ